MTTPTSNGHPDRAAWVADASWVWNDDNRDLSKSAPLRVDLYGSSARSAVDRWLTNLTVRRPEAPTAAPQWCWGGFVVQELPVPADRGATPAVSLELRSGGEDAFESLEAAARWLHDDVVAPHQDVTVRWTELPLRDTQDY